MKSSLSFSIVLLRMEEFSDVEDGEDPYYPETERVLVTVTRSGRKVFAPQRLVVDPYIIPSDEDDDGVSIPDDDGESDDDYSDVDEDEEDPEGDYAPSDEEMTRSIPSTPSTPSTASLPLPSDDEQDDTREEYQYDDDGHRIVF